MVIKYKIKVNEDELYKIANQSYENESPWNKNIFSQDIKNKYSRYLIIEVDNKLIGFIGGTLIGDELSISNIAIIKEYQNQHYGEMLIEHYFTLFQETIRVLLEVRVSNFKAIKLYRKIGFTIYSKRIDYYKHPIEDAFLMDIVVNKKRI